MVKLSSVAEILNGDRSSNYPSGKDFIAYGIPFINAGHLKNGKIDFSNMDYISKQKYEQLSGAKIQKKDILLCLRGSLGKYAVAEIDAGAPASSIAVIRPNETIIASEFLTCIISSFLFQKQIDLENNGSSQPNLSASSVANFIIPFPPLDEQKRIAEALSDVDSMISSLEKLIAKKKAVKQGAMQELLTGKKRLPEFTGEWNKIELKELIKEFIVPMRDKPKDLNGPIPWCRIEDFNGKYLYSSKTNQGVTVETISNMNLKVFPKNTLLVSCSAYLGRCAIVGSELITNQTFIGLVPNNKVNVEFLFHIMTGEEKNLNLLSSGTTISYLSREQFEDYKIYIPCDVLEQTAIASILSDMDNEIESLEQKLKKTCQLKQGMMQQLLTGKIRLV